MKIALLGGTFNPIHRGHLLVADHALHEAGMDRVLFVPCAVPSHKVDRELLPAHHRLAMIERAIRHQPRFGVLTLELERGGTSYTVNTLSWLREQHPHDEFFFIMGSDNFRDIGHWKRFPELIRLCQFLIIERPGCPLQFPPPSVPTELLPQLRYSILKGATLSISSSEIRKLIRGQKNVSPYIPSPVYDYIQEHSLFSSSV